MLERAQRRMVETTRFFVDTMAPGGLRPGAPGWRRTIRVRLMHASMHRWLRQQQKHPWNDNELGAPINQMDLAATSLLFSVSLLRHLRKLGFHFTAHQTQGVMHLWRYSGHLLGIAPELLSATEAEGGNLCDLLWDLAGPPDLHSRQLTQVLMETALPPLIEAGFPWACRLGNMAVRDRLNQQLARFCYGLSHGLVGDACAADLQYPRTAWRFASPLVVRPVIRALETCRRFVPGGTRLAARRGFKQICGFLQKITPGREAHEE
jgi:hypothetical protein